MSVPSCVRVFKRKTADGGPTLAIVEHLTKSSQTAPRFYHPSITVARLASTMDIDGENSMASSSSATTTLAPMARQAGASNPEDDWTGVTDPKERRRVQNRLAQRNWRKKIHQSRHFQHPQNVDPQPEVQNPDGIVVQLVRLVNERFPPGRRCCLEVPGAARRITQFAQQAYQDYTLAAPRPAALQTLVQLNVFDAIVNNAAALNISAESLCAEDTLSPFVYHGPYRLEDASVPPSLQPTALQRAVYHHPWVDLFPLPEVRDSILRICGTPEEDELNIDLVDVEENDREKPNLVIWGHHSDPWAWEATIPFLRKWGWLVRDCQTLLESTNYWREKRGDKRLIFPRQ